MESKANVFTRYFVDYKYLKLRQAHFLVLMQPEIPQELIDLIIDEVSLLDCDVRPLEQISVALRSCLFVSISFCRKARSHLFRNVRFRSNQPIPILRELSTFLDLLISSSYNRNRDVTPFVALGGPIASLVKTFHLPITRCGSADEVVPIFNDRIFISVLRYLTGNTYGPSMVRFDINTIYPHPTERLNWELLSTASQAAFRVLFQSSRLDAIHLFGFQNLPSNFLDGSQIKHLEILNAHCSASATMHSKAISNQLQLESIYTDQTICLDHLTLNGISITSNLKNLGICPVWPQTLNDNAWRILDKASRSLKRLRLQFKG
jgi:hypothetical protein